MVLSLLPKHSFCKLVTHRLCRIKPTSSSDIIVNTERRYEDMRRYLPGQLNLYDIDGTNLGNVNPLQAVQIAEKRDLLITGVDHKSKIFRLISRRGLEELKKAQAELMKTQGVSWKKAKSSEIRITTSIDPRDLQLRAKNAEKLLMKGNTVIVDIKTNRFKPAFGVRALFQSFLAMIPRELVKKQQENVKKNNTRLWAELKPNIEELKPNVSTTGADSFGKDDSTDKIMKFSFLDERAYFESLKNGCKSRERDEKLNLAD